MIRGQSATHQLPADLRLISGECPPADRQMLGGQVGERLALFEKMQELVSTDGSRKAYRAALKEKEPPCIPFLGVYLTDLTFIHEGNVDTVDKPRGEGEEQLKLINWVKQTANAEVIESVRFYQTTNYNLSPCVPRGARPLTCIKSSSHAERKEWAGYS